VKSKTSASNRQVIFHKATLEKPDGEIAGLVGAIMDITEIKQAEIEKERLIAQLQGALDNVKLLSGLLPICASCKKVKDDQGYWNQIEIYIRDRSEAEFSHGICPDCMKKLYPEYKNRT
jgi:PAS domain-containing protein